MDYLPKALENGVVAGPPSHVTVLVAMNLFSLMQQWNPPNSNVERINGAQGNLYLGNSPPPNCRLHMV